MSHPIHKSRRLMNRQSEASNTHLQRAIAERERYLENHPQLMAFQSEIDRLLDLSGSSQGRMAVLATLMQGKLLEMAEQFKQLNRHLNPPAVPPSHIAALDRPTGSSECSWQNCI